MWPFFSRNTRSPSEWELFIVNEAGSALSEQRFAFISYAPSDEDFLRHTATDDDTFFRFFEGAFLWGFFRAALREKWHRDPEQDEIKSLIELWYCATDLTPKVARANVEQAAKNYNAGLLIFDNVANLAETCFPDWTKEVGVMVFFFKLIIRAEKAK